jgi:hypothetical protein
MTTQEAECRLLPSPVHSPRDSGQYSVSRIVLGGHLALRISHGPRSANPGGQRVTGSATQECGDIRVLRSHKLSNDSSSPLLGFYRVSPTNRTAQVSSRRLSLGPTTRTEQASVAVARTHIQDPRAGAVGHTMSRRGLIQK